MKTYKPFAIEGVDVMVFDHLSYIDDIKTPLSTTMKKAKITHRYIDATRNNDDKHQVEVMFYHNGQKSKGHFVSGLEEIK